ncbi:molybdate transport system substrate-binding protein [Raineyella antarctica]|uniref:Molybdate transport system substrate-binding protein n=1 Tax=Raineyella antarctica TaxID=1577474 RepID=A0A1G6HZJ6_9ACTN|nr:molybdate ABC transporter substrate-binding protein [Raineyella antarctica]SDB99719.1 molybdate transport system substrate-binding protein [Raineyella antarctica]
MKRIVALVATLPLALVAACGPAPSSSSLPGASAPASTTGVVGGEVQVYAPGALAAHTDLIAAAYAAARPGATAAFEVSHTPTQYEQLKQGSTTDVWIAANPKLMAQAGTDDLVLADPSRPVVRTKLAIVTAPGNPAGISSPADLAKPGVKLLLAEDQLPIGMAVSTFLQKMDAGQPGYSDRVKANVSSRELGVKPIVAKVGLGEADAGIVFVTDVDEKVGVVPIPDDVNAMLSLEVAPVTKADHPEAARQFVDYLASPQGIQVLLDAGYLPSE